jgi:L-lysine 2,3-aminomutase
MKLSGMVQKQLPPKSIRLHPDDLERSQEIAAKIDLSWHGYITRLIKWGNSQKPKHIKMIIEDQERVL